MTKNFLFGVEKSFEICYHKLKSYEKGCEMRMSWLQSLIFGLFSGFAEFLPISSEAHMVLLGKLFGMQDPGSAMRFSVHFGAVLALALSCMPQISKIMRENRIASTPVRSRKRQPDTLCLLDWRVLKSAAFFLLIGFVAYPWVGTQGQRLWILCLGLVFNGIILYFPQFMPGANKDARSITKLDALLIGLSGAIGVLPGISRVGSLTSVASVRGCQKEYALHLTLLLSVPALCVLLLIELAQMLAFGIAGFTFLYFLGMITSTITSFFGAYFGIKIMRFLSVKAGYSMFAYYSWGAALFAVILYLAV